MVGEGALLREARGRVDRDDTLALFRALRQVSTGAQDALFVSQAPDERMPKDPRASPEAAQVGAMPAWARALLIDAVKTISEEVAGLRALHQTRTEPHGDERGEGPSSQRRASHDPPDGEDRTRDALRARILGLWARASGNHAEDPERVVAWAERSGQEILDRTKSSWEKVARHIVDELVPEPGHADAPRERSVTAQRWEGIAKRIVERVVDASLEQRGDRRGR